MPEQKFDLKLLKTWAQNRVDKLQEQFRATSDSDRLLASRLSEAREFLEKILRVE